MWKTSSGNAAVSYGIATSACPVIPGSKRFVVASKSTNTCKQRRAALAAAGLAQHRAHFAREHIGMRLQPHRHQRPGFNIRHIALSQICGLKLQASHVYQCHRIAARLHAHRYVYAPALRNRTAKIISR